MLMQCKPYNPTKIVYPTLGQIKMNGIFGRWDSSSNKIFTRAGNEVNGLTKLKSQLVGLPSFDGELVIPDMEFFEMNGLLRREDEKDTCMFYVFDMPMEGVNTENRLKEYHGILGDMYPNIHPLKYFEIANSVSANTFFITACKAGHEGVVYKNPRSIYYDGKRWDVQKRVQEYSTEAEVIRLEEGKGKMEGMLGAFICNYNGVEVNVGTGQGMTYDFRTEIWHNPNKYLGRKLKVSYKSVTPDGSLQSPKFQGIRWDI